MLGEAIASCTDCGVRWVGAGQIARIKARRAQQVAWRVEREATSTYAERFAEAKKLPYDTRAANAYALPAALLLGVLAHLLGLSVLVWGTLNMWFHELGHAIVAWLGGFVAAPLPFFTLVPRKDRSVVVITIVVGTIGAIAYEAVKRRLWTLVAFAGVLAGGQLLLTFVLDTAQARQWWIFAGQGGAIVLPTLVMLAFYQRLGWRWDFWRYPVVALAAVGFVHAMSVWIGVARGTAVMPHGSAVGSESEGDMERLVRDYHWTKESLAETYLVLGLACLGALVVAYVVYWHRRDVARATSDGE